MKTFQFCASARYRLAKLILLALTLCSGIFSNSALAIDNDVEPKTRDNAQAETEGESEQKRPDTPMERVLKSARQTYYYLRNGLVPEDPYLPYRYIKKDIGEDQFEGDVIKKQEVPIENE